MPVEFNATEVQPTGDSSRQAEIGDFTGALTEVRMDIAEIERDEAWIAVLLREQSWLNANGARRCHGRRFSFSFSSKSVSFCLNFEPSQILSSGVLSFFCYCLYVEMKVLFE